MTREQFRQNLKEAIEFHNGWEKNEDLEKFLDLNFDEDISLSDWTFADFNNFAIDIVEEGLWIACSLNDLHYEGEDDEDDEESEANCL